jgi:hypothetical protein
MSTDFKSADQKLKDIISKCKDVDPDLRFMALNDLNKLLVEHNLIINKVNSYSSKISHILLEALGDTNSDVQNQALKCFEPLVPSLDDDEITNILVELNKTQITHNSITTSIHTMAIGEILKNVNLTYGSTGELIITKLLPSFIAENGQIISSLDAIETLTDLITNLGPSISQEQSETIYQALVKTIFNGVNTLSKKSITCLGFLVPVLSLEDFDLLLKLIDKEQKNTYEGITLTLLTYISLGKANPQLLAPYVDEFMKFSFKNLYLDNNDFDDDQVQIDDVRFEALQFINTLLPIGDELLPYIDEILSIVERFLRYDPYANNDADDEDELSDPEFSDEEDFDDLEDENDDNTWKLRKQSASLTNTIVKYFPTFLLKIYNSGLFEAFLNTISDSSESVSFEKINTLDTIIEATINQHGKRTNRKRRGSDVSMSDVEDSLTHMNKYRNRIVVAFTQEMKTVKQNNTNKFNIFLTFFQSFSSLDEDLELLLSSVREHNFGLNLDLLKFYSAVLENNDLKYFGNELDYIVEVINGGLTGKNHISILNSIETSIDLLNLTYNDTLAHSIIQIAGSSKNDSELRNTAIQSLADLRTLPSEVVSQILTLLVSSLNYEPIVISTINVISSLVETYHSQISISQINEIVNKYEPLTRNTNYSANTVESLSIIVRYFNVDTSIGDILLQLFNENKHQSQILKVLSHLNYDNSRLKSIFLKASLIDEVDEEALLNISKKIGSELIPDLERNSDNTRNIKILANIVISEGLTQYIRDREQELLKHENTAFNIKLLGFIGEVEDLTISVEDLIGFFQEDESKIYAAETLGKLISKNHQQYVGKFLEKIRNDEHRYLLLISIKQVLKTNNGLTFEMFHEIWDTIFEVLVDTEEFDEDLSKISALSIGLILINNNDKNYFYNKACDSLKSEQSNESIIYSIIASIKFILAYDDIASIELLESLLLEVFDRISDEDLRIKQISLITLVTALNNQFSLLIPYLPIILPKIYEELAAKKQYQETLQIGPFKHKVDKALEIRKNAFEILYKLSSNHSLLKDVDFNEILSYVIHYGLAIDIISMSSLIIIKLLEFDDVLLSAEDKTILSDGIGKLLGKIKKKEDQQKDSKEEQETKAILLNLRNSIFEQ